MAFDGHIREISHEGGMLAPFTGEAPKLGQIMQLPGGKVVGKVDTVIGEVTAAVVHINPFRDIEVELLVGQPVELAPPKEKRDSRRERNDDRGAPEMKEGDWTCEKCSNHNFAWRDVCNRCEAPKTGGGGGGQRRDNRGGDRRGGNSRGNDRGGDRRGSQQGGSNRGGGDRRSGGFQQRDNRGGDRRGGDSRGSDRGGNDSRPPRREYRGSNDRKSPRRDARKPGGWGPKSKGGPRRR